MRGGGAAASAHEIESEGWEGGDAIECRYVPDVAAAQITQLLSMLAQQARCPEGARVGVTALEDGTAPVLAA